MNDQVDFHPECIDKIEIYLKKTYPNIDLIEDTEATYIDDNEEVIVVCLASEEDTDSRYYSKYEFNFQRSQKKYSLMHLKDFWDSDVVHLI